MDNKYVFLDSAVKNLNSKVQLISNDIENALIKISNDIHVLSKTPPIQGIIRSSNNAGKDTLGNSNLTMWKDRLSVIFSSMLKVNPNYTQIRYIGRADQGKEIVRVDRTGGEVYRIHDTALQSKGDRDYFQQGVNLGQGSIQFSRINYNVERGKLQLPLVPTLRVVMPIYTKKQQVFGVLAINVNILRYIRNILLRSAGNYNVLLYDNFGDLFSFDNQSKTLRFIQRAQLQKDGFLGNKNQRSTQAIVSDLKRDSDLITILKPIYASHHNDQTVLTMVVSVSKSSLKEGDKPLVRDMLFWVIGICLLASLFIFLFAKYAMTPLAEMAKAIKDSINEPGKELYLPTQLNDEVGLLAMAFEQKAKLLSKLALFDSLTGLPNRKKFVDHLASAMQRSTRKQYSVAVIYLDVNKFKEINDNYGHHYGDELLIQFSSALREITRESDFCARLGGDEFAVVVEDFGSNEELQGVMQRYHDALNKTYTINGVSMNVEAAGGVALYPEDAAKLDDLLKLADQAMYRSKASDPVKFCMASEVH